MVKLVSGGAATFNALSYQEHHPSTLQYLSGQFDQVAGAFSQAGQSFLDKAKGLYEQFNSSEALRRARALARATVGVFQRDEVRRYMTLGEIQQANQRMQRWIMADPATREEYHALRCDGYSDTYVDMHPGDIGEKHYDYRLVMDGVMQELPWSPDKPDEPEFKVTFYMDELAEGDRPLDVTEVAMIQEAWALVHRFRVGGKEDPTSSLGGML